MPSGRSPSPFGFGIITRRTGLGRLVFKTNSSRKASQALKPDVSIAASAWNTVSRAPPTGRATSTSQLENRHRFMGTVVRQRGQATLPTLIGEPDKIKAKRPTGGLMLRRDGTG